MNHSNTHLNGQFTGNLGKLAPVCPTTVDLAAAREDGNSTCYNQNSQALHSSSQITTSNIINAQFLQAKLSSCRSTNILKKINKSASWFDN